MVFNKRKEEEKRKEERREEKGYGIACNWLN